MIFLLVKESIENNRLSQPKHKKGVYMRVCFLWDNMEIDFYLPCIFHLASYSKSSGRKSWLHDKM